MWKRTINEVEDVLGRVVTDLRGKRRALISVRSRDDGHVYEIPGRELNGRVFLDKIAIDYRVPAV